MDIWRSSNMVKEITKLRTRESRRRKGTGEEDREEGRREGGRRKADVLLST